jgi:hypothetical protein
MLCDPLDDVVTVSSERRSKDEMSIDQRLTGAAECLDIDGRHDLRGEGDVEGRAVWRHLVEQPQGMLTGRHAKRRRRRLEPAPQQRGKPLTLA